MRAIISRRSDERARTAGSSLRTTTTTVGGTREPCVFRNEFKTVGFFLFKTANVREKADDTGDVRTT